MLHTIFATSFMQSAVIMGFLLGGQMQMRPPPPPRSDWLCSTPQPGYTRGYHCCVTNCHKISRWNDTKLLSHSFHGSGVWHRAAGPLLRVSHGCSLIWDLGSSSNLFHTVGRIHFLAVSGLKFVSLLAFIRGHSAPRGFLHSLACDPLHLQSW